MKPNYRFFANGKSATQLEQELMDRFNGIADAGYELIVGYSCQWKQIKDQSPVAKFVVKNQTIGPHITDDGMTEEEILNQIQDGHMDGFILASAVVPLELREFFSDLPPLFKRAEISRSDLSPAMLKYCERNDLLKTASKQLVTGYHMTRTLYYSYYVRYLLDHGVKFYAVERVYQFRTAPILRQFLSDISKRRMEAQLAGNDIKSNNLKLICNSVSYHTNIINV